MRCEDTIIKAVKQGDTDRFQAEIEKLPDLEAVLSNKFESDLTGGSFGAQTTLLQFASSSSPNVEIPELLLSLGAELDFHSACALGRLGWIQQALATDVTALDWQVDTYYPLQYAIPRQPEVLRLLMEHGDDPNRPIRKVAWFYCEEEAVRQGLKPWRPIHMVALHGYHENSVSCATILSECGADLNAESPLRGYQPLHLAATPSWTRLLDFLIDNGVKVDTVTDQLTPSVDWSSLGNLPDKELFDVHGDTALMVAAREGHPEAVKTLLKRNAIPNATNSSDFTPLHLAAAGVWSGREDAYAHIVNMLLERSSDVSAKDNRGRKAMDMAKAKDHEKIIRILQSHDGKQR